MGLPPEGLRTGVIVIGAESVIREPQRAARISALLTTRGATPDDILELFPPTQSSAKQPDGHRIGKLSRLTKT